MSLISCFRARFHGVSIVSSLVVVAALVSISATRQAAAPSPNNSRQHSSARLGVPPPGLITPAGSTITVNSISDVVNGTDGLCTLREAIVAANSNLASGAVAGECVAGDIGNSSDTITFTVAGTINLAGALPDLTSDMSINGPGSGQLTVRRNTGGDYRIFFADNRGINISGMTITNGKTPDGISGSASGEAGGNGGGILQINGVLTLSDVVITGNRTGNGGAATGGSGSVGGAGGYGGGIYAGGVAGSGTLNLINCVVSNNITGLGGTGATRGTSGLGGGIMIASGQATLTDSTVSNNLTGSDPGTVGRGGNGGGIFNNGNLTVLRSTINGNATGDNDPNASSSTSGGGIDSGGPLTLINSTISGNRTGIGANQIGSGGVSSVTTMVIINCTITGNTHFQGTFGNGVYGSIHALVRNSVIAGNGGPGEPDVIGTFTSQGHNLIGKAFGNVGFVNGVNGDQVGTLAAPINALLGSLANNGGLTRTHALNTGSPALDAGDDCVTQPAHCGDSNTPQFVTDQRGVGFGRMVDGPDADSIATVDMGSFEAQAQNASNTTVTSSVNPSDFGETVTFTATVTSGAGTPNGSVQFKDNGTNLGAAIALNASGSALLATSGLTVGTHTITAEYSGSANFVASTGALSGGQVVRTPPALTIDDPATFEGNSGTRQLTFSVSLLQPSHLTVTVNFATAAGTADTSDFTPTSGSLTFTPGQLSKAVSVTINGDINFEPNEDLSVNLSAPVNATISKSAGLGTILNDDAQGGFVFFDNTNYNVSESGSVNVVVNRTNDVSRSATVDYFTNDAGAPASCGVNNGLASSRCDFVTAIGTLTFAPGETLKTITIIANRDSYTEVNETFTLNLQNPTGGAVISTPSQTFIRISDDGTGLPPNAIDDARNFVRQHYLDFLNRQPDQSGWDFWTNQITSCGSNTQCTEVKRIDVSASFFLSIEFQQTGYLVERFYKVAYGDGSGSSTLGGQQHQLAVPIVRVNEFLADTQRIGRGVIVLQPGWEQLLESNKLAYALEFVRTSRFTTAYPAIMTPAQFVDKLNLNAGDVLSASERAAAINLFGTDNDTTNQNARSQAVRMVAEDQTLYDAEFRRAFVLAQYFGYLRRNPNDAPESTLDYTGYDFWLTKLNQFNGNYINAEMVKAFLSSIEYRQRFGP